MKIPVFLLGCILSTSLSGQKIPLKPNQTVNEITNEIIKNTGAAIIPNTVDMIKEGNPETTVSGIITCMFATMDVLKQAVDKGCNLIVTHEPVYYNHLDETEYLKNDPVFLEKKKYINDHQLVIWRFHDYVHSMKPDGILSGMTSKLGWSKYAADEHLDLFHLPEMSLKDLLAVLKSKFPGNSFYVVGNPETQLFNVFLAAGAPGSELHIQLLENENIDIVITGESPQWETYEYTRDAVQQGRIKAVIFLGHISSEEAGMEFCAQWMKGFVKDIPIYFIENGAAYWSY